MKNLEINLKNLERVFGMLVFNPCLIFLVYNNQHNHDLWESYKKCPVFFYRKNEDSVLDPFLSSGKEFNYPIETKWGCITIADCMLHCLSEAYKNTENNEITHFIFASGACAPIFEYEELLIKFKNQEKGIVSNKHFRMFKNLKLSQWSIINRSFAKLLVESPRIDFLNDVVQYRKEYYEKSNAKSAPDEIYINAFCKSRNINIEDYFDIKNTCYHGWDHNNAKRINREHFYKIKENLMKENYISCRKVC